MNLVAAAASAAAVCAAAGCRGDTSDSPPRQYFPDLDDQPKLKAQTRSTFFKEFQDTDEDGKPGGWFGRSMREPVAGTVPFGAKGFTAGFEGRDFSRRAKYLRDDDRVYRGEEPMLDGKGLPLRDDAGVPRVKYVKNIPVPVTAELLALGQKKYDIYCLPCHGGDGAGKGLVGVRWAYGLPSFHQDQYRHGGEKGDDGYLFHVIRNGVANPGGKYPLKMPSYAQKVDEFETWAIVAHLRVLQASQGATPADVPGEADRIDLERRRDRGLPAPAATGATGPTGAGTN
ncbi:MAG: cytochrome c [Phycisphaerales bacterium]|nr:cytochrome c [Phycisphaerales bacterium]